MLVFLCLYIIYGLFIQPYAKPMTKDSSGSQHVGTSFAFAFPMVHDLGVKCEFVITALVDANVHIEATAVNMNVTHKIAVGTSQRFEMDCKSTVLEGEYKEKKAIYIKSDVDVMVEVLTLTESGGDSFLLLPLNDGSPKFITAAYFDPQSQASLYSMVTIVNSGYFQRVKIFRRESKTYVYEREIGLYGGEVATIKDEKHELTGMYIECQRPVTVIAGATQTHGLPQQSMGIIYTVIPPISTLGYHHILLPFNGREDTTGYYAQVAAVNDNTEVTVAPGLSTDVLLRGQYKMIFMNSPKPTTVMCSDKCLVNIYSKVYYADVRRKGMTMMRVPSISQTIASAYFNTFRTDEDDTYNYYVSLLSTTNDGKTPEYMLDNEDLRLEWVCVHNGFSCDYMYTNFTVREGSHLLKPVSATRFLAWSYAYSYSRGTYGNIIGLSDVVKDDEISPTIYGTKNQASKHVHETEATLLTETDIHVSKEKNNLENRMELFEKNINGKIGDMDAKVQEISGLLKEFFSLINSKIDK